MKPSLLTTSEWRFIRGADGQYYTRSIYPYTYWQRLLAHFGRITIAARVTDEPVPAGASRVDGPGVTIAAIPDFIGGRGLLATTPALLRRLPGWIREHDAFLLRVPGVIGGALWAALTLARRRFAVEVVGDPLESLRGGRWSALATSLGARQLRAVTAAASVSRYVTAFTLQRRYPPAPRGVSVSVSDVDIPAALLAGPAPPTRPGPALELVFVGSLSYYKGVDVLLAALRRCAHPHRLTIVGDGALRGELERAALPLGDRVRFLGALPVGQAVRAVMQAHDLLVLPSRGEGLPRVVIEAMAVGVPCVATDVGGTAELLNPDQLVPADAAGALARAIDALAAAPGLRRELADAGRTRVAHFVTGERDRRFASFFAAVAATATPARAAHPEAAA